MGGVRRAVAGAAATHPLRGEVWFGNLDPIVGPEQGGDRPVLVDSQDADMALPRDLLVVVPLTRTVRGDAFEVPISPPEANLAAASAAGAVRSGPRPSRGSTRSSDGSSVTER